MRCNSHCPQEGDNRYPQEHNWQRRAALQVKSLMQLSACARNCAARWRSAGRAAAAAATRLLRQPGRWRSRVLAGATAAPGAASAQQRWQTLLSPQRAASQTTAGQLQRRQNCSLRLCPLLPPLARCLSSACCWSYCWRWGGRATRAPRRCWRPQQPQGTLQRKCEACRGGGGGERPRGWRAPALPPPAAAHLPAAAGAARFAGRRGGRRGVSPGTRESDRAPRQGTPLAPCRGWIEVGRGMVRPGKHAGR